VPARNGPPQASRWLLVPNLGAEEGGDWTRHASLPAVRHAVHLWGLRFPAAHRVIENAGDEAADWPGDLGERPERAAFRWLDERPGVHAWLGDASARDRAQAAGAAWTGPDPALTRAVHDKGFALQQAEQLGFVPRPLRGCAFVVEPDGLADPAAALAEIESRLSGWPSWMDGFVLKPRSGSSGRGRVAGSRRSLAGDAIARALPRLAERGGAVVEPWLERNVDLSVALELRPPGDANGSGVTLLGSLESIVTHAGVPLGHVGEVDSRGRVFSGTRFEEEIREAAAAVAGAARDAGWFGPCGVDSFAFRAPDEAGAEREWLRPVVELNARYTLGLVAIGVVRRLLGRLRDELGLGPGARRAFLLALRPPPGFGNWSDAASAAGPGALAVALAPSADAGAAGPGLVVTSDRTALEPLLEAYRRSPGDASS